MHFFHLDTSAVGYRYHAHNILRAFFSAKDQHCGHCRFSGHAPENTITMATNGEAESPHDNFDVCTLSTLAEAWTGKPQNSLALAPSATCSRPPQIGGVDALDS